MPSRNGQFYVSLPVADGGFGADAIRNIMNTPMLRAERQASEEKSK